LDFNVEKESRIKIIPLDNYTADRKYEDYLIR
jgi:hypothetical protein